MILIKLVVIWFLRITISYLDEGEGAVLVPFTCVLVMIEHAPPLHFLYLYFQCVLLQHQFHLLLRWS